MKNSKILKGSVSGILLCSMLTYTVPVFAFSKDETVYSKMNNEGKVYNTIVSEHLKNVDRLDSLEDVSDLLNIKNTNGDEEFSKDGNKVIWNAKGNDIYYQGEINKELPIETKVTYYLNGEEMTAKEIAGKTGKVTIRIKYTNNEAHKVLIDGRYETMYTPFVVVAGTMIDNENNQNITVTNGKIIDQGRKSVVVGMAMPGLQESLKLSKSDVVIPSSIEITMDSKDFEMGSIINYATPKVFEKDDIKMFDELDGIFAKVDTLQSSSKQLEDGINQLKEGIQSAYDGSNQIKSGVNTAIRNLSKNTGDALDNTTLNQIGAQAKQTATLSDEQKNAIGTTAATTASKNLTDEYLQKLGAGAAQKALTAVDDDAIKATAKQIIDTKIDVIKTTAYNKAYSGAYAQALKTILTDKAPALKDVITTEAQLDASPYLTAEQKLEIKTNCKMIAGAAALAAQSAAAETAVVVAQDTAVETAKATTKQVASEVAKESVKTTTSQVAKQVAQSVATQTAQTTAEATAMATAKNVANQVKQVASTSVASQMGTLANGLDQLTDGLGQLNEGAEQLAEGMNKFNEEGIDKICSFINSDVKNVKTRISKLAELSQQYNTFTMSNENEEADVKFITIIDKIEKEKQKDDSKEKAVLNQNTENRDKKENK